MLRKKYKIIEEIIFERVEYSEDPNNISVCEYYKCEFCGPDFDFKYCEYIKITKRHSLLDLCWITTNGPNELSGKTKKYSYIPSRELYEPIKATYKLKKKKR